MAASHILLACALAFALVACGAEVTTPGRDASLDVSPDAPLPDGATCAPRVNRPTPAACEGLTELADPSRLRDGVYSLDALRPVAGRRSPTCDAQPWPGVHDARARFTAPVGGRWRFTARGEQLWALGVLRGCAMPQVCVGESDLHGAYVSTVKTLDVQLQRGEAVSVVMNGCPDGTECRYDLRAQRLADLACEFVGGLASPCASGTRCTVDACDPEQFQCVTPPTPRLRGVRVLSDRTADEHYVVGHVESSAPDAGALLMVRWLDASGAEVPRGTYLDGLPLNGDEFVRQVNVPSTATRARFWFYTAENPDGRTGATVVDIEPWTVLRAGAACGVGAFAERCGPRLRCASGVCAVATTLEITRLRGWRDVTSDSVRIAVEGVSGGVYVQGLSVDMLDVAGNTLAQAPTVSVTAQHELPSRDVFSTSVVFSNSPTIYRPPGVDPSFRVPSNVARVRVTVRDMDGRRSAPVTADLVTTRAAPLGETCDTFALGCAPDLACVTPVGSTRARCEPSESPRVCGLSPGVPTWAPPAGSQTYTLTGVYHAYGGITQCASGKGARPFGVEFVAPVAGLYVFESTHAIAIQVTRGCDTPSETHDCVRALDGSTSVRVEATLAARDRVPLRILGATTGGTFELRAQVP